VLRSKYSSSRCKAFQRPSRRRIRAELLLDFCFRFRFRFIGYFFFLDSLSESNVAIDIFFTYRRHFTMFYVERPRFHAFHALHYSISLNALTLAPFHHVLRGTSKIPFTPFTPLRNFSRFTIYDPPSLKLWRTGTRLTSEADVVVGRDKTLSGYVFSSILPRVVAPAPTLG
jgi:hypothetical protein